MKNYFDLLKRIDKKGKIITTRGHKTKELINEQLKVDDICLYSVDNVREDYDIQKYLFGEMCWYLAGNILVDGILPYSKFWKKVANKDGTVNSNYGYLVFHKVTKKTTQYNWCLKSLLNDEYSRQAVILYNDKDYYFKDNKDFVCTQLQQFFIRDNKLISIVYIRSSDCIRGITFDVPWWRLVQKQLCAELKSKYKNLTEGDLIINFGSVHFYEEHFDLVKKMLRGKKRFYELELRSKIILGKDQKYYEDHYNDFIAFNEK